MKSLESTKKALDLAECTLISLKKKVYPVNPQKYSILAEPYLEYINRLRTEKDEYIGLSSAEELAYAEYGSALKAPIYKRVLFP